MNRLIFVYVICVVIENNEVKLMCVDMERLLNFVKYGVVYKK